MDGMLSAYGRGRDAALDVLHRREPRRELAAGRGRARLRGRVERHPLRRGRDDRDGRLDLRGGGRHQGQRRPRRRPRSWSATTRATSTRSTPRPGAQRWRYTGGQRFYGGPAVSGGTLVIGDVGGAVIALDAAHRARALASRHRGLRLLLARHRRRDGLHRLLRRRLRGPRPRRTGVALVVRRGRADLGLGDGRGRRRLHRRPRPPGHPAAHVRPRHGDRGGAIPRRRRPLLARGRRRRDPLPGGDAASSMPTATRRRKAALWVGAVASWRCCWSPRRCWGTGFTRGWFDSGKRRGHLGGLRAPEGPGGGGRHAGAWPEYGFDARRAPAPTRPSTSPPPFRRAWSFDAGSLVEFPPVIADGRAVVGHQRRPRARPRHPHRARAVAGASCAGASPPRRPSRATCALFTTMRGDVIALRRAPPASSVWRRAGRRRRRVVAARGRGLGATSARSRRRVMRLDARTGGVRWSVAGARRRQGEPRPRRAATWSSATTRATSTAFRRSDGRESWRAQSPGERAARVRGASTAGPAVAYGRVFIGNVNGRVLALDARHRRGRLGARARRLRLRERRRRRPHRVRGQLRPAPATRSTPSPASVRWSFDAGERISGSASVVGDVVYVSTLAGSPRRRPHLRPRRPPPGGACSTFPDGRYSPAVAIDGLLVLTGVRTLYGLRRGDRRAARARRGRSSRSSGWSRGCWASPARSSWRPPTARPGATDAYVNSLLIVNAVAAILLYTLVTLIIPTFQRERADRGADSAWRLVSALAVWVGGLPGGAVGGRRDLARGAAALFHLDPAREAARPRSSSASWRPALALQGFSAIFTAMLQIHGRFAGPAAVGVAFNLGIIVGVVDRARPASASRPPAWGVVLGATLQVVLQLPQFWRLLREAACAPGADPPAARAPWGCSPCRWWGRRCCSRSTASPTSSSPRRLEAGRVSALSFANALGQAPRVALLLPAADPALPADRAPGLRGARGRGPAARSGASPACSAWWRSR